MIETREHTPMPSTTASGATIAPIAEATPWRSAEASAGAAASRAAAADYDRRPARQSELSAFLDDVSELLRGSDASDLREMLEQRVAQARDTLSQAVSQAQEAGAVVQARARESVHRTMETSRGAIVERPLSAVAIAAVGGLVIGLLLGSRR